MKWIKFVEKFPPSNGIPVLIAMRNKNMGNVVFGYMIFVVTTEVISVIMITGKVK